MRFADGARHRPALRGRAGYGFVREAASGTGAGVERGSEAADRGLCLRPAAGRPGAVERTVDRRGSGETEAGAAGEPGDHPYPATKVVPFRFHDGLSRCSFIETVVLVLDNHSFVEIDPHLAAKQSFQMANRIIGEHCRTWKAQFIAIEELVCRVAFGAFEN